MCASTGGLMRMTFGKGAFSVDVEEGSGPVYWFDSYFADHPGSGGRASIPKNSPLSFVAFTLAIPIQTPEILRARQQAQLIPITVFVSHPICRAGRQATSF